MSILGFKKKSIDEIGECLEDNIKKALEEWKDAVGRYEFAEGEMLDHIAYDIKSKESKYILLLKQLKEKEKKDKKEKKKNTKKS